MFRGIKEVVVETYYRNKHIDPRNESTDFEQAIKDEMTC